MTARDRTVLVAVVVVAAIVAAWMMLVAPVRSQASKLGGDISAAQGQLDGARAQITAGEAARATFAANYTTMARLGEAVPSDDNVPSLIYQVQAAANATRVDFQGLTLVPGSGGSAPAASATASASAAQSSTAALPPGATVGAAGFPVEPFTFTFNGNFFHLSDFFGRLERFVSSSEQQIAVRGRLMTLNAISLSPGPRGFPQITATVSATTYILPATQGLQAGATSVGPASTTVPASSGGSSSPVAPAAIGAVR